MAPMTRDRARPDGVPTDLNREYYRQRASMALILTEGTQPPDDGQGYDKLVRLHETHRFDTVLASVPAGPAGVDVIAHLGEQASVARERAPLVSNTTN
jgi:2,4-dienoyl-CoA reductase-like NADH-dependent reductase (Old Yellow Enzyme family)